MSTPIGDRLERFPLDAETEDRDPVDGSLFIKRSFWEGDTLMTIARDPTGKRPDFVVKRRVLASGQLEQTNEHNGMSMVRLMDSKK